MSLKAEAQAVHLSDVPMHVHAGHVSRAAAAVSRAHCSCHCCSLLCLQHVHLLWQGVTEKSLCMQGTSAELRQLSAEGLGDLVQLTDLDSLKPFVVQITGALALL